MEEETLKDKKNGNNSKEKEEWGGDIFGLGGLFKGIEKLVETAGKLQDINGISKQGEINLDRLNQAKGVYGFTIRSVLGGEKPIVDTFGNIKKTPDGPRMEQEREPMTDVFEEEQVIIIVAEMPGIEEDDIVLDLTDDILDISAERGARKYHKELLLPVKAAAESMKMNYNNGILEIRIGK
jgi:HSP20 family protein